MSELFKPISVKSPVNNPWLFKFRCIVDLQLATISKHLQPALKPINGSVLDVGAGQSPWCSWLPKNTTYQGIDIKNSEEFGMKKNNEGIMYYDGTKIPFDDNSFDNVLCIEVLEHALEPQLLLSEITRVLKPNGNIFLTVPWSARRHHIPYDFHRFSRERLQSLFSCNGFSQIQIKERGSDIGVIANKLILLNIRLIRVKLCINTIWKFPLGICCLPISIAFLVSAHLSEHLGLGSPEDPLGYFVQAVKTR